MVAIFIQPVATLSLTLAQIGGRTAAAPAGNSALSRLIVPAVIVIVLAAVLLALLGLVRRRLRPSQEDAAARLMRGFTLDDLRQMKRDGQLTDVEFERAKAKLVASMQSAIKPKRTEAPPADAVIVEPKE